MPARAIAIAPSAAHVPIPRSTCRETAFVIAGVSYLVLSLCIGVWYLSQLAPSLANDLWWPSFSPTRHQAFLIDLVNAQLTLMSAGALNLYGQDASIAKVYDASLVSSTNVLPTYARNVIFAELTSIEYAVRQLRTLSASWSMRMNTQHCWVDFNQTFEVAHTLARQGRCQHHLAANAVVYMEAILRNVV